LDRREWLCRRGLERWRAFGSHHLERVRGGRNAVLVDLDLERRPIPALGYRLDLPAQAAREAREESRLGSFRLRRCPLTGCVESGERLRRRRLLREWRLLGDRERLF